MANVSTNTTTSEDLDKIKTDIFREIDGIFDRLQEYNRLPKTFFEVQYEMEARRIILDDLKNARDSNGTSQSNGTNWIKLNNNISNHFFFSN